MYFVHRIWRIPSDYELKGFFSPDDALKHTTVICMKNNNDQHDTIALKIQQWQIHHGSNLTAI